MQIKDIQTFDRCGLITTQSRSQEQQSFQRQEFGNILCVSSRSLATESEVQTK